MSKLATTREVLKLFKPLYNYVTFVNIQTDEWVEGSMLQYPDEFCIKIEISKAEKKYHIGIFEISSNKDNHICIQFHYDMKNINDKVEMSCQTFVNSLKSFNGNLKSLITYIFRQIYLENNIPDNEISLYWDNWDKRKTKPDQKIFDYE